MNDKNDSKLFIAREVIGRLIEAARTEDPGTRVGLPEENGGEDDS